jgi:predicted RNase H-like nuclease
VTVHGGLDGCRGGWVLAELGPDATLEVTRVDHFGVALARVTDGHLAALAVDMPIGLPDTGERAADREGRRRLGARRSTIFPTPCRATLDAATYAEALAISRRVTGKGLSVQAYNLLARIREVDDLMHPELQDRVVECHPELAFARLAGAPVARSKHTPEGLAERVDLLDVALRDLGAGARTAAAAVGAPPPGSRPDDVADAIAIALVARLVPGARVERLGDGELDRRGLRMEIVA